MHKGRIIKSTGSWYEVRSDTGGLLSARLKGRFKLEDLKTTNPLAVGDVVMLEKEENDWVISEMCARGNYIIRKSPRQKHADHIVAANLDRAYVIVCVEEPRTSTGFIDRFLLTAEAYHIPATIVINKTDLQSRKGKMRMAQMIHDYELAGYEVLTVSCEKNEGINTLATKMSGKTNLLCGHSGVGKSTLINLLIPGQNIRTENISGKHKKGIHTTTFAEMHELPQGGYIIDTPGIKEFGISDMAPEEVGQYFIEFRKYLPACKFSNCTHITEPQCAVLQALDEGNIAEERYKNYLQIMDDLQANYKHWE